MTPTTLQTPRLTLRPFAPGDVDDIVASINFREVWATTLHIPHPYTRADAEHWIRIATEGWEASKTAAFALIPREGERAGTVSGGVGLSSINSDHRKAELGFWLTPSLWGRGLMTEAAGAVVRFGFERLNLNRIYAGHFEGNIASRRIQEKLGFRREGLLLQDVFKDGRAVDHVMMALLREEWERQNSDATEQSPVPVLKTRRLILRGPERTDVEAIHELHRHKAVADGVITIPHPHTLDDARAWLDRMQRDNAGRDPSNRNLNWLICSAESGRALGDCTMQWNERHSRAVLGYLIHPDHWNRGYITEALEAVLDMAFRKMALPLHRIQADHFPENPASGRVLEKLGFTREGVARGFLAKEGRHRDIVRWALLRPDYLARMEPEAAAAGEP